MINDPAVAAAAAALRQSHARALAIECRILNRPSRRATRTMTGPPPEVSARNLGKRAATCPEPAARPVPGFLLRADA